MDWREHELSPLNNQDRPDYQSMIDYIKAQVGEGREYLNDLVRVVLSDRGCYYEFRDLPEEFSGAVGSGFRYEFVGTRQGLEVLKAAYEMVVVPPVPQAREASMMVIYGWDGIFRREDTFIYHWSTNRWDEEGPVALGVYRPGVLPLFFKLKVDCPGAESLLGASRGVLFFVANLSDQHLLVTIPHHGPGVTDLNEVRESRIVH